MSPMRLQAASVYLRAGQFYVHADSRTTDAVWIPTHPFFSCSDDIADDILGDLVLIALGRSCLGVPPPLDLLACFAPLFRRARVASAFELAEGTVSCGVSSDGRHLTISPCRASPAAASAAIISTAAALATIGAAVRRALVRAAADAVNAPLLRTNGMRSSGPAR